MILLLVDLKTQLRSIACRGRLCVKDIRNRTMTIIDVPIYGYSADMDLIAEVARLCFESS